MELRTYWQIIWRRRQVIVPLVLVTFFASALANLVLPPTYKAETMVLVQAIMPPPAQNPYYSDEYYRTIQSEYATDDLGMVVKTESFAEKVAEQIESRFGIELDRRDIKDSVINARKLHRTLKITIATSNYALTKRISDAMNDVLTREGGRLVSRPERQLVDVIVIDPPSDPTSPSPLRRLLDVLLHSAVAVVVGAGIAFLLHALDDRVHNEADAREAAGWPVVGAIPGTLDEGRTSANGPLARIGSLLPRFRRPGGTPARTSRSLRNAPARRPSRASRRSGHRRP